MATFTIGEEVLYDEERFVVTLRQPRPPYAYRLVRTTSRGPEVVWVEQGDLGKIEAYTRPAPAVDEPGGA